MGNLAYSLILGGCEDEDARERLKEQLDTVGNPQKEALKRFLAAKAQQDKEAAEAALKGGAGDGGSAVG